MTLFEGEIKLKIFLRHMVKTKTQVEIRAWQNSPEGLRFTVACLGSTKARKEAAALKKLRESETLLAWEQACFQAWGYDHQKRTWLHRFGSADHLAASEQLCVSRLFAPPHFRVVGKCVNCGVVLMKDASLPCPWCATSYLSVQQQLSDFAQAYQQS